MAWFGLCKSVQRSIQTAAKMSLILTNKIGIAISLFVFSQICIADSDNRLQAQSNHNSCTIYSGVTLKPPLTALKSCAENESFVSTVILNGTALFAYNTIELSTAGLNTLRKLITELRDFRQIESINIIGHTDSGGPKAFNQHFSEMRARYIGDFFSSAFPNVSINTAGRGESEPIAAESSWFGRYQNRRVEIEVMAVK